ncbi:uncharacterized protein VICG_01116 [Vittaforma corneae ATCC 50505]|uniref:Ricin B lectin domain-containing protein n=1 Tax=Vittaforma corneae (strain ATCC 50505) TaxID=993615 RepID=L2GMA4_VITCO|nr:uncharacterized protein VICG_01116 [Vittaforma corneae ATCC 50505]ELA41764.1 hypothetical protein VICG_01116 [Vittaforma corneae ATCC 50505]
MKFLLCIIIAKSFVIAPYEINDSSKSQERLTNANEMVFSTTGTPLDFTIKNIYTKHGKRVGKALYTESGRFLSLDGDEIHMTQLVPTEDNGTTIDERIDIGLSDNDFDALNTSVDLLELHNKIFNISKLGKCLVRNSNKNLSVGSCKSNQAKFILIESDKDRKKNEKTIKSKEEEKGGKDTSTKTDTNSKPTNTGTPANTTFIVLNGKNTSELDSIQSLILGNKALPLQVRREHTDSKQRHKNSKRRKPHSSPDEESTDLKKEKVESRSMSDEEYSPQLSEDNEVSDPDDNKYRRRKTSKKPQSRNMGINKNLQTNENNVKSHPQPIILVPVNQTQPSAIQPSPNSQIMPSSEGIIQNPSFYSQPSMSPIPNQPTINHTPSYPPQTGSDYKKDLNNLNSYTSPAPSYTSPSQTSSFAQQLPSASPQQIGNNQQYSNSNTLPNQYIQQLSSFLANGIPVILGNNQSTQSPGTHNTIPSSIPQTVPNTTTPGDTQMPKQPDYSQSLPIDIKGLQQQLMNVLGMGS